MLLKLDAQFAKKIPLAMIIDQEEGIKQNY